MPPSVDDPNFNELNPIKLLPDITTELPPAVGPLFELTDVITGIAVG